MEVVYIHIRYKINFIGIKWRYPSFPYEHPSWHSYRYGRPGFEGSVGILAYHNQSSNAPVRRTAPNSFVISHIHEDRRTVQEKFSFFHTSDKFPKWFFKYFELRFVPSPHAHRTPSLATTTKMPYTAVSSPARCLRGVSRRALLYIHIIVYNNHNMICMILYNILIIRTHYTIPINPTPPDRTTDTMELQ